jgi:hypothetical protein
MIIEEDSSYLYGWRLGFRTEGKVILVQSKWLNSPSYIFFTSTKVLL